MTNTEIAATAEKATKTFAAEWAGRTFIRKSGNGYKFASVVRWSDGTEAVASWHALEAAAARGVLTAQQKANGAAVIAVVPVSV